MATRNYLCPGYGKRMKSTHGLTKHKNIYTSHQVFSIYIQSKQNTPIPGENDNISGNFEPYKNEKSTLEEQDIKRDHRNLVGKSSVTESHVRDDLSGCIPQTRLIGSESSSSLKEIRFSDQEFATSIPVSNIKYNYLRF